MLKEVAEVKKVCQFLSQILTQWQYNADFNVVTSSLIELLKGSIDFYRFKEIFPYKLPNACLEVMELHLNLIREQFAMGLLEIQFINNPDENKYHNKISQLNHSNSFKIQNNPIIDVNRRKIQFYNAESNHLPISIVSNDNNYNKLEVNKTITASNTTVRPISFINNNIDKTKIVKLPHQISIRKNNSFPIKSLPSSTFSVPNERPIVKIYSQNQNHLADKIIKTESTNVVIPAKKKIIGISNQCDTHSELKALPSLQTFDLSNTLVSKIEKKSTNNLSDNLLDNSTIAREEQIAFIVDEMIQKVATSSGITIIDDNVVPYVRSMLDTFSEQLLVHAAYYTMHREDCKNTFKSDSVLYKETDNVRAFHKSLKNSQQLSISNQEREEKEKLYFEKGKITDSMKRKEEMKVFLTNSSIHKSNSVLGNIFGNNRKINCTPVVPTIRIKKRITAKDFLIVFRQNQNLQKIKTFKLIVAAANQ